MNFQSAISFLLAACILFISGAYAQDATLLSPQEPAEHHRYDDVPDEYLIEAMDFADECSNDQSMPLYYDCRCMGAEYLERRIKLGPDAAASLVRQTIGPSCADGTGIAGRFYEDCAQNYVSVPDNVSVEDFCSCYGNTYAKMFERLDRPLMSREHIQIMTMARVTCRDPNQARRIFGYVPN